ncbi:MAG: hypothetical protein MJ113_01795 [Lachnospiraceae bacterium]|nr:hypothetical protein [Lachnospiraceae bacterium]
MRMKRHKKLFKALFICSFYALMVSCLAGCGNDDKGSAKDLYSEITPPAKYTPVPTKSDYFNQPEIPPVIPIIQGSTSDNLENDKQQGNNAEPTGTIEESAEITKTPEGSSEGSTEITANPTGTAESAEITTNPTGIAESTEITTNPTGTVIEPTTTITEPDKNPENGEVIKPMATFTPAPTKEITNVVTQKRSDEEIKALLYYIIAAIPKETLSIRYDCFEYHFEYELQYLTNIEGNDCYRVDLTDGTYKARTIFVSTDFCLMYILDERSGGFIEI